MSTHRFSIVDSKKKSIQVLVWGDYHASRDFPTLFYAGWYQATVKTQSPEELKQMGSGIILSILTPLMRPGDE